jgi:hypothetical protein
MSHRRIDVTRRLFGFFGEALGLVTAGWILACGGGSASDVLPPESVSVTFDGPGANPRSVGLQLVSATDRELEVDVVATSLEHVTGVAFELDYDPGLLEFVESTPGSFFGADGLARAAAVEGSPGQLVGVAAAADQRADRSGTGVLVTLSFRLRELRDADSPLTFRLPESQMYGAPGSTMTQDFASARLITRIRATR